MRLDGYRSIDPKCPVCGGNLVPPSELGFYDDGLSLTCDGEIDGSGCDFWVLKDTINEIIRRRSLRYRVLRKLGLKREPVYDITSMVFHQLAEYLTGLAWDFRKPKRYMCAVQNCHLGTEWGYWTCRDHRMLELKYFDPVNKDGSLFWSHRNKDQGKTS